MKQQKISKCLSVKIYIYENMYSIKVQMYKND